MKTYDFVVCGHVVMNQLLKVKAMPRPGITSYVTNGDFEELFFGGNGLNISYCLAKLGCRVLPVLSHVVADRKAELERMLGEVGAPACALRDPQPGAYGLTVMVQDESGEHMTLVCRRSVEGSPPRRPMPPKYFLDAEMAVLCVAHPDDVVLFLESVKRFGTPLAFSMRADTKVFPPAVLREILLEAKIIFANEEERAFIERSMGYGSVLELMDAGKAEIIVVTLGERGSVVYAKADGNAGMTVEATRPPKVVDATGAGDAYVAGFLYGYCGGMDLRTCAEYGGTMASFIIEKDGCLTNVPSREDMLARNASRSGI